jgi:hypothetical protein
VVQAGYAEGIKGAYMKIDVAPVESNGKPSDLAVLLRTAIRL